MTSVRVTSEDLGVDVRRTIVWAATAALAMGTALAGPFNAGAEEGPSPDTSSAPAPSVVQAAEGGRELSATLRCDGKGVQPFEHTWVIKVREDGGRLEAVLPEISGAAFAGGPTVLEASAEVVLGSAAGETTLTGSLAATGAVRGVPTVDVALPVAAGAQRGPVKELELRSVRVEVVALTGVAGTPGTAERAVTCAVAEGTDSTELPTLDQRAAAFDSTEVTERIDAIGTARADATAPDTLPTTGSISGTVALPEDALRSEADVSLVAPYTYGGYDYWEHVAWRGVGPGGRYSFPDVAPGTYTLAFSATREFDGYAKWGMVYLGGTDNVAAATRLEVRAGTVVTGADAHLFWHGAVDGPTSRGNLTGQVILPVGLPRPDELYIEFYTDEEGGLDDYYEGYADVQSDGRWTLSDAPAVTGVIYVSGYSWDGDTIAPAYYGGSTFESATRHTVVAERTTDVGSITLVRESKAQGRVTVPAGNDPYAYVSAWLHTGGDKQRPENWRRTSSSYVEDDGQYLVRRLGAGTYRFLVEPDSSATSPTWVGGASTLTGAADVLVGAATTVTVPPVTLKASPVIRGRVIAPAGVDLTELSVTATDGDERWDSRAVAADGTWEVPVWPGHTYTLNLSWEDGSWTLGGATPTRIAMSPGVNSTGHVFDLRPSGRLSGSWTSPSPGAETWKWIEIYDVATGRSVAYPDAQASTWVSRHLPVGRYAIKFGEEWAGEQWLGGSSLATARVLEVTAGARTDVGALAPALASNVTGYIGYRDGYRAGSAYVEAQQKVGGVWTKVAHTTASSWGWYEFLLAPGTYRIMGEDYMALAHPTWLPSAEGAEAGTPVEVSSATRDELDALILRGDRHPVDLSQVPERGREGAPIATRGPVPSPTVVHDPRITPTVKPTVTPTVTPTVKPTVTPKPTANPGPKPTPKVVTLVKKPKVTGKAKVGKTLKASKGSFKATDSKAKVTVKFQWQTKKGKKAVNVSKATKSKLKLTKKLRKKQVRVRISVSVPGHKGYVFTTKWSKKVA